MRNPWVHDDMSAGVGSGYGGKVRLLGAFVWGTLLLGVGGSAVLIGTGAVEPALPGSLRSAVTFVVAGTTLVLLSPLILRLLAISRLLAATAFLASSWLLGRFVWSRESERIERLLLGDGGLGAGAEGLGTDAGSVNGLVELLEALLSIL
ncbi:hypothetical protein [Halorubrum sp. Boch-26]|uniref:hypothetical protein n=1 Tax=Halorubrum sp. Boch-26 TaxID=2994426 RepID=UPI002469A425|nr:hypothetical protein [Halorubrum sp. Boch-26]